MSIKLLTTKEASAYLINQTGMADLSPAWVKRQIDTGKLAATVVAKHRRIRQDRLDTLISTWLRQAA